MFNRHKRIIAGLATTLAALGVAVGSGASFTSQTANPSNTFASGIFTHSNTLNGTAIVTGSNMKPGDVKTGEVTIKNTGTIAGTFKVTESNVTNGFTNNNLQLKIDDLTGGSQVYAGPLGGAGAITLESYDPGEAHTYRYTVTFKDTADNNDQGKNASADYTWTAIQD